jgi:hypothetical protein
LTAATLANLLAERDPIYGEADVTVISRRSPVADVIIGDHRCGLRRGTAP